jgi:hypothetical protein
MSKLVTLNTHNYWILLHLHYFNKTDLYIYISCQEPNRRDLSFFLFALYWLGDLGVGLSSCVSEGNREVDCSL